MGDGYCLKHHWKYIICLFNYVIILDILLYYIVVIIYIYNNQMSAPAIGILLLQFS